MAGFADVLLRGFLFTAVSIAAGGVAWVALVLGAEPGTKLLCAAGGGMLLTHSHRMFHLKEEFLTEITHAPLGIVSAFAGWARWLELRLPGAGAAAGWVWRACLVVVGLILLFDREG